MEVPFILVGGILVITLICTKVYLRMKPDGGKDETIKEPVKSGH